jgi:hypothetical protein
MRCRSIAFERSRARDIGCLRSFTNSFLCQRSTSASNENWKSFEPRPKRARNSYSPSLAVHDVAYRNSSSRNEFPRGEYFKNGVPLEVRAKGNGSSLFGSMLHRIAGLPSPTG